MYFSLSAVMPDKRFLIPDHWSVIRQTSEQLVFEKLIVLEADWSI